MTPLTRCPHCGWMQKSGVPVCAGCLRDMPRERKSLADWRRAIRESEERRRLAPKYVGILGVFGVRTRAM